MIRCLAPEIRVLAADDDDQDAVVMNRSEYVRPFHRFDSAQVLSTVSIVDVQPARDYVLAFQRRVLADGDDDGVLVGEIFRLEAGRIVETRHFSDPDQAAGAFAALTGKRVMSHLEERPSKVAEVLSAWEAEDALVGLSIGFRGVDDEGYATFLEPIVVATGILYRAEGDQWALADPGSESAPHILLRLPPFEDVGMNEEFEVVAVCGPLSFKFAYLRPD